MITESTMHAAIEAFCAVPPSYPFHRAIEDRLEAAITVAVAAERERLSQASKDVLAERERQIVGEGWDEGHDDRHISGALSDAAACYARAKHFPGTPVRTPLDWPFNSMWWKPTTRRRNLVKAGAMILAEIERLDRIAFTRAAAIRADEQGENK